MPEQKIRFAVGTSNGPRSAVWSLFWHKHDAYVSAVEAGGIAKVSFHLRTGEFSWGYTREYFEKYKADLAPLSTRDFDRWKRPGEYDTGITLPLRIFVANEALKTDPDLPTRKQIRWVTPRPGRAVGFSFLIAAAEIPSSEFEHEDLEFIGRATFVEHPETILLLAHQIDAKIVSEAANRSIIHFTAQNPEFKLPAKHRLYAQQEVEPNTGSQILIEIPTYVLPHNAAS
jgi:hypothetical protein